VKVILKRNITKKQSHQYTQLIKEKEAKESIICIHFEYTYFHTYTLNKPMEPRNNQYKKQKETELKLNHVQKLILNMLNINLIKSKDKHVYLHTYINTYIHLKQSKKTCLLE